MNVDTRFAADAALARIKMVHTSDVHLDTRNKDAADENGYRTKAEAAFGGVVDLSISEEAELLLIAGDLFDNNRVDDSNIRFVYEQLARTTSTVVIIPGNHDVHDERSVWNRFDFDEAGDHVHGLMTHAGETKTFEEINVRVWGKAMEEHAPENYPLDGTPERIDGCWNVGMAHGQVTTKRIGQGSSPILFSEIEASGFDYLAMGHIHVWGEHDYGGTIARYCGSPVAHYAGSAGGQAAVIELCPVGGVTVTSCQVTPHEGREIPTGMLTI